MKYLTLHQYGYVVLKVKGGTTHQNLGNYSFTVYYMY